MAIFGFSRESKYAPSLLRPYVSSVEASADELPPNLATDPRLVHARALIKQTNDRSDAWDDNWLKVFRAERLIAQVTDPVALDLLIDTRILELEKFGVPTTAIYREQLSSLRAQSGGTPDDRTRILYLAVLDDLQWSQAKRHVDRRKRYSAATRIGFLTVSALALAMLPYFLGPYVVTFPQQPSHMFLAYTAMTFGLLGALFSRLIALYNTYGTLDLDRTNNEFNSRLLAVRMLFGAIGSLILFYLLCTGAFQGNAFPNIDGIKPDLSKGPDPELAKLILWSTVGGFSERLVAGYLQAREISGLESPKPKP